MANFGQPLNQDSNGIRTSARFDTPAAAWLHDSAMWAKNAAGVYVPVSFTDPLPTVNKGDYTTPTHSVFGVTTATLAAKAANASRQYLLLVNDSDTTIYIALGAAAALNQGIRLNANGGNYEMSMALGNVYTGAVNAIHGSTGTKNLLLTEGV